MTFLRSYGGDGFTATGLQGTGTGRMAGLAETYVDLPPGIAGAPMAAIAECLGLTGIATLDHRHFGVPAWPGYVHGTTQTSDSQDIGSFTAREGCA